MGFRFRKSISLGGGTKLNIGTKSASVSFGTKGVRKTISTSGRETTTFSIPGTGVSYVDSKKSSLFGGLFGGSSKKTAAKKTKKK
ncbi:MAG: DUF4236 domain-containing protein [Ruminococcus sp.]|jgi:hypothetical protein|nr:DUF4236 domain-containing protein [Ruminococcus sp.]MBP3792870.1 DUF4236 domain-containing protein [Ruminococcus sp.]MBQ1535915.1 DUF4236 domain-containing protein [Ruminococcus sp.]MBQ4247728.1 DUF4236 domain-containing protein [Ruminococcus sp.]MBR7007148.1 DUF4236 domain-containing protein [Ruminococcus sp.]